MRSLPVPLSPVMRTVLFDVAMRCTRSTIRRIGSDRPRRSRGLSREICARRRLFSAVSAFFSNALWTSARSSAVANGLVMKSYAPRFIASIAISSVECAVMMITSVCGLRAFASVSRSRPEPSGMTRSLSTTP